MIVGKILRPIKVSFISTYPPRKCGIATFTSDLLGSMKQLHGNGSGNGDPNGFEVIALNSASENHHYGREVTFNIRDQHRVDYQRAADFINHSAADAVSIQHEFGIFGGDDGSYITSLLGALKNPAVTTLHTILEEPTAGQKQTLIRICEQSVQVVVMAQAAVNILKKTYGVPEDKILLIPHGAPDVPFLDSSYYKEQFQAEGKKVLLTFGLLGPSKGLEYIVEAMEKIVQVHPDALYLILGATHPEITRRYGEQYRHSLEKMVQDKGLTNNVTFYNQYVSLERLVQFLVATDIYITPYLNREQITSGTLAYALACGKAIISTPYVYAEELLADERGCLVPFRDSAALADAAINLLSDEGLRNRMRKQSYQYGRQMIWKEVAQNYTAAFQQSRFNYRGQFTQSVQGAAVTERAVLPEVNLKHLRTLTDYTGLLQHAAFEVPDRQHGYCTDDNARALIAVVMNWRLYKDESIWPLLNTYLGFLNYALNQKHGRTHNFMSYDRKWLDEVGSEDCHGRTLWALGYAIAHAPSDAVLSLTTRLFKELIEAPRKFTSPRAWAFSAIGANYYLRRFGGDARVLELLELSSKKLLQLFTKNADDSWYWCEDIVTYDNARIPQALIINGSILGDSAMSDTGLKALQWLIDTQTEPERGHLSIVGNEGWYRRGGIKARFNQQALDATALTDACYQAYMNTGSNHWAKAMEWAFNWFFGNNDVNQPLYNFSNGGCFDGIHPGGINQNQGAESVASLLLALQRMHIVAHQGLFQQQLTLST
ncbi:MAG TPA: glycosyltransferase family 4 protein [Candidatus Limnocylindrales bacterium]|nr:glycosyltransferase family 4 protein [Candidatus Limnocylindrales bacterium]